MLRSVSTLSGFKRIVSRTSTVLLVAGLFNLAFVPFFDDRIARLIVCPIIIVMSLIVKRALAAYDANPARSLSIIEANFYGLCMLVLVGSIYPLRLSDPDRT